MFGKSYADESHELTDEIPLNVDCQLYVKTLTKPAGYKLNNWMGVSVDKTESLSPTPLFHDDLMGNIQIGKLWMRAFGKNRKTAAESWKEFRKNALNRYDAFDGKLVKLESVVYSNQDEEESSDITTILQKGNDIDAIFVQVEDYDVEFTAVSKIFEQFSQYLPNGEHRKRVEAIIGSLRKRYFNFLQELNRKKAILRWTTPKLQRYKPAGNEIKAWLDTVESRSEAFTSDIKHSLFILDSEEKVEEIVEELHANKCVYEDFLEHGKGIIDVDHHMQMKEVEHDVAEVVPRWDSLCENIEKCLHIILKEKKAVELKNKKETNKIDTKIEEEIKMCTCFTPFNIIKVGNGKYTFGTSKTVRLLRINGSSIVVRIGGGWEYLYNFLSKVDPCRAAQHATAHNNELDASDISSTLISSLNKHDSTFNMSVKRTRKTYEVLPTSNINCDDIIRNPVGQLDRRGNSIDSPNLSVGLSTASTSPISPPKGKFRLEDVCKEMTPNNKSYQPTANMERRKSKTRRVSLIERQSLYAPKR